MATDIQVAGIDLQVEIEGTTVQVAGIDLQAEIEGTAIQVAGIDLQVEVLENSPENVFRFDLLKAYKEYEP